MKSSDHLSRLKPEELEQINRLCRQFILASIVYFFVGSLLGVLRLLGWSAIPPFIHLHLNFFGWISMMIFGVGYKLLPNYAGKMVIYSLTMARIQFWFANLGFIGMLCFYALWSVAGSHVAFALTILGAATVIASIALFGLNVWLTFRPEVSPAESQSLHRKGGQE